MAKVTEPSMFPGLEQHVIQKWRDNAIVKKILERVSSYPEKFFLDGPPFATGTMHYGHILVSTVKDTMARYFTMNGFKVDRRNSWDTHGVPIEMLAKNEIGYHTKEELLSYGIDKHNQICRQLILKCAGQWYTDFERIGRWIDIDREYKTMDTNYMESVIWAFKQLYENHMIVQKYTVMPYSTGCATVLSHFEAKQNYKEISDPSVICCFTIVSTEHAVFQPRTDYPTNILAWTTTPWTLPSNMAICANPNSIIIYAFDKKMQYYVLVSKDKFMTSMTKLKYGDIKRFEIISELPASDLANIEYKPPFPEFYFRDESQLITERPFRIILDQFVIEGENFGTGFVHCAPAFGPEDFKVCCSCHIIDARNTKKNLINPIDDNGCFTKSFSRYAGIYFRDANVMIINYLKENHLLFESGRYTHTYPFCYRTDTPLIYRIVDAWFLEASNEIFREKMLANNKKINWLPSHVGTNHFDNWLQGSVDWCISRSRYWGTPIPIWQSADGEETICIGSIAELESLSGQTGITDLHPEHIDHIKIPSRQGRGMLSRVSGVLDCWFESGSASFAQFHYPFENMNAIHPDRDYLVDFITESKDQTRGWFYTLTVLATALFDKPAFHNVIVTGIVNGTDGQKMSKHKKNYPDPNIIINKYGADTLRFYLLSTPVVKAESVKFNEDDLYKIQQNSISKVYNMTLFLLEKIKVYQLEYPDDHIILPQISSLDEIIDPLNKWIVNKTIILVGQLAQCMDNYLVTYIAPKILTHIDQLTNWYLKMSRERMKGTSAKYFEKVSQNIWKELLETLLFVLVMLTKALAPIMPFITETIYDMLRPYIPGALESVHFESYPDTDTFVCDYELEKKFSLVQQLIVQIRNLREKCKLEVRRPLLLAKIGSVDINNLHVIEDVLSYIKSEANVYDIELIDIDHMIKPTVRANMVVLKTYLKQNDHIKFIKHILDFIDQMTPELIVQTMINGQIIEPQTGIILDHNHLDINYELVSMDSDLVVSFRNNMYVEIDITENDKIKSEHLTRSIKSVIQRHRNKCHLEPWQTITLYYHAETKSTLHEFINANLATFTSANTESIHYVDTTCFTPEGYEKYNIVGEELYLRKVLNTE